MRIATQAWRTAAQQAATLSRISASYQPVWVVELVGIHRAYATRALTFSRVHTLSDGLVLGSGATLGSSLPAYGLDLARLSSVTRGLTERGTAQVGNLQLSLLNQEGLLRSLTGTVLDNTRLRLRLGFVGLGYDDFLELWSGLIDRLEDRQDVVTLECVDGAFAAYPTLSIPLSPQFFPATPQANKSRSIPLLLGANTDVETIQVSGAAQGTLAFAMSSSTTVALLTEFGAPFPASGALQIGTEVSITYARRALITNPSNGKTSLQLSGLVRSGTPAAQTVGTAVTLVTPHYDFLIGYQIADLQAVRVAGALITAGFSLLTLDALRPVSVLRFTSAPALPVTVDVNAGSLQASTLLVNGGFETGDLTGWTTGAGATAAVGTSSPTPDEGVYRASLEGDQDVYRDLYQDVSTQPGAEYLLTFVSRDDDGQLLTNGGFETGDLTGWTLTLNPAQAQYAIINATQPYTYSTTAFGSFEVVGYSADGTYALLILPILGSPGFAATLVIDGPTSIGTAYTFAWHHITQDVQFVIPGSLNIRITSYIEYAVGTIAAPDSLVSRRIIGQSNVAVNGQRFGAGPQGRAVYRRHEITFTATDTTTRLTLYLHGLGTAAPTGGGIIPPPPLAVDAFRLYNASEVDTANVAYQIGTTSDPDAIYTEELAPTYTWVETRRRFRATEAVTRLTWRSQHSTATVRQSYLDNVQLQRVFTSNANPVEQIRYILDTFLPKLRADEATFLAAYDARLLWRFGTVLFDPGDSRALLNRMAAQCACQLIDGPGNTVKIVALDADTEAVWGFDHSNIVEGSFTLVPDSLDQVYTEVYVWFGARTGGSTAPDDFAASTYCTPYLTTHPDVSLPLLCQQAIQTYKHERRLDVFADFIQDIATANLLLLFIVRTVTLRQSVATFTTWLDACPLELGDVILVEDPRYPGIQEPYAYRVQAMEEPTPDEPFRRITVRSLRQAGWSAQFELVETILESEGFTEGFDS